LNFGEAVILGIIQGLTEFLPVSSSGHLVIAQSLIKGFQQPGVFFDVTLHLGTLSAVIFFFRKDLIAILRSLTPGTWSANPGHRNEREEMRTRRKWAFLIVIGTIPAGVVGLLFKDEIHRLFESVEITAIMLMVTGLLLFATDYVKDAVRRENSTNIVDSIIIGLAQAVAIIPGISRSGSTIAFGIFRKLDRETSARFSFLLSIPAVFGAAILESQYITGLQPSDFLIYGVGFTTAAITAFLSLHFLFLILRKIVLRYFAYYCWCVGTATLIFKIF
jgi:undecaprenyl-diphosphatase